MHADACAPAPGAAQTCRAASPAIEEAHCPVVRHAWVNRECRHLVLAAPDPFLAATPGQFFHLRCPATGEARAFLRRPMSLYSLDRSRGQVEFLYKVTGAGTRALASLERGDVVNVLGPLGTGFNLHKVGGHALLLGRGTGVATLNHLAECLRERHVRVTAVLSARTREGLVSEDRLAGRGVQTLCVTDEDGSSDMVRLGETLRKLHDQAPFSFVATCGSQRMIRLLQSLEGLRDLAGQAAIEQPMACALGMCWACVHPVRQAAGTSAIRYERVCVEGPVFDLARLPT